MRCLSGVAFNNTTSRWFYRNFRVFQWNIRKLNMFYLKKVVFDLFFILFKFSLQNIFFIHTYQQVFFSQGIITFIYWQINGSSFKIIFRTQWYISSELRIIIDYYSASMILVMSAKYSVCVIHLAWNFYLSFT